MPFYDVLVLQLRNVTSTSLFQALADVMHHDLVRGCCTCKASVIDIVCECLRVKPIDGRQTGGSYEMR
jgi:hypothetical protein